MNIPGKKISTAHKKTNNKAGLCKSDKTDCCKWSTFKLFLTVLINLRHALRNVAKHQSVVLHIKN